MRIWLIQQGEPLQGIDSGARDWRCGILAKTLVARGHEVLWWASTFNHAQKCHRFNEPRTIEIMPGLKIRLLHGPGYGCSKSPRCFWHHRVLAGAFAKEASASNKPDLIFSSLPTLELAEQAVLYGQRTRVPVLVDVRDLWPDLYLTLVPRYFRFLLKIALSSEFRRGRRLLAGATGITAISNTYLEWALKNADRQRRECDGVFQMGYHGQKDSLLGKAISEKVETLASAYGLGTKDLILTFVGSFTPSFDMLTVIEAARIINQNASENIKFLIVGEGDMGEKWRLRAKGIDNIIFTGWFDQVSIAAIFCLSNAGLAPYDNALISLPNKPFEYMAAGLPLLSSLRGELEDLIRIEQIGLQYQAGKANSLVEQIRWLVTHPAEREDMGLRARRLFEERFSAEVIYPRLVEHLEKVACHE